MTAPHIPTPTVNGRGGLLPLLWRGPLALVASGLLAGVLTLLVGASAAAAVVPVAVTVMTAAGIAALDPNVTAYVRGWLGWYAPRHAVRGRYSPRHLTSARTVTLGVAA